MTKIVQTVKIILLTKYLKDDNMGVKLKKDNKMERKVPFGSAYINGHRIVFEPYEFQKGRNKGKIQCYYRKGSGYKKTILNKDDIKPLDMKE